LPLTGFAPGQTTLLPDQPAEALYTDLGTLWLEIPSLGVKARIVGVPATSGVWDLTWLGDQIGYLYGTSYPTWSGNTGLTGHVYTPNGKPGPFANLHTMTWGQQIIVLMDGQQYIFEVRYVRRVLPDDLSVLGHAATPTLTLITCQGYDQAENDYHYRVAVRAVLVQILPDK
jgi:LPXTG-site transpeptidase (sortase) family protein